MTRPFIGPDMTYDEQRKCRMQDAIDDYLSDENTYRHDKHMMRC